VKNYNTKLILKEKRREMIRNVQTILAKLESKVPTTPAIEYNSNQMETALVAYDPSINNNEQKEESLNTEQSISTTTPFTFSYSATRPSPVYYYMPALACLLRS